jgi:hypothetical protein
MHRFNEMLVTYFERSVPRACSLATDENFETAPLNLLNLTHIVFRVRAAESTTADGYDKGLGLSPSSIRFYGQTLEETACRATPTIITNPAPRQPNYTASAKHASDIVVAHPIPRFGASVARSLRFAHRSGRSSCFVWEWARIRFPWELDSCRT